MLLIAPAKIQYAATRTHWNTAASLSCCMFTSSITLRKASSYGGVAVGGCQYLGPGGCAKS